MATDEVVLSYHESLLRASDMELLKGPHWLNDNIISFYFEYLQSLFKTSDSLLFISPEVTQCIKIVPEQQLTIFLDPLNARSKKLIFFAVNDNNRPLNAGGTHWSLLVYSRNDRIAYHYDSCKGTNSHTARGLTTRLFTYFGTTGDFKEDSCPQQNNGYDCGIHLLCVAEYIAAYASQNIESGSLRTCNLQNEALTFSLLHMRQNLIDVIYKLKAQGRGNT